MPALAPDSKPVLAYYAALTRYDGVGAAHEQAVKTAFHTVLQATAGTRGPGSKSAGGRGFSRQRSAL